MADERCEFFSALNGIESTVGVTFFVIVLTPDMFVYHKKDSIEFSMALKGQSVAAVTSCVQKLKKSAVPGKLLLRRMFKYHHTWWTPIKKLMDDHSEKNKWFWFLVAFDGSRMLFTAESENFPLSEDSRNKLLDAVDVVWGESSRADLDYARDTYIRRIFSTARHAAGSEFFERKGIRRI